MSLRLGRNGMTLWWDAKGFLVQGLRNRWLLSVLVVLTVAFGAQRVQ